MDTVIVKPKQTIQDPSGNYDVIYVDVMRGGFRVRRFVKPMSKEDASLENVIAKAKLFAKENKVERPMTEYIG